MKRFLGYLQVVWSAFYYATVIYYMIPYTEIKLKGKIEDCCCEFDYLKQFNHQINPTLTEQVKTSFFRLYKVNLEKTCPFWAQTKQCKDKNTCGICPCDEKDIPKLWKEEDESIFKKSKVNAVDQKWSKFVEPAPKKIDWVVGEDIDEDSDYVDLTKNDESYTGYEGSEIWNIIYEQNCFNKENLCMEERLLNRAISGMHSSVSSHQSYHFKDFKKETEFINVQEYFRRVGDYPERIQNLYFSFSILVRALNRATEEIQNTNISTGDFIQDNIAKNLLKKLTSASQACFYQPFDESKLFKSNENYFIKDQVKQYFQSITSMMNCVECEKCKVYGKMQIEGLGTAFKLLFDDRYNVDSGLRRNELIALINTMKKWSDSQLHVDIMNELRVDHANNMIIYSSFAYLFIVAFTWLARRLNKAAMNKFKRGMNIVNKIEKQ